MAESLEARLRARRDAGGKALVPYVTGGVPDWITAADHVAAAGADALEIGIPFSDPVMDGPVIQAASESALDAGATPAGILDQAGRLDVGIPMAAMPYYNLVFRFGHERFAAGLVAAGFAAAIVPDLPLEESSDWTAAADDAGVETVLLAAPTADDDRLAAICARARGFVYGVGVLGVTGERQELAASARTIAGRLKAVTDLPVLVGVGISTPEQAASVCETADGVVVGSAVVRTLSEKGPEAAAALVGEFRAALERG